MDKLRLVLVFYLSSPDNAISKDDIAELEKELKAAGADVAAFEYVRRTREILRMTMPSAIGGSSTPTLGGATGGELFKGFSALGNRVTFLPPLFHRSSVVLIRPDVHSSQTVSKMVAWRISFRA